MPESAPSTVSLSTSVKAGNCEVSVMVAGDSARPKTISSTPPPAGQSVEPDWSFPLAFVMASRKEH